MSIIKNQNVENNAKKEKIFNLSSLIAEANRVLEVEGREKAIALLPNIYDELIALNARSKEDHSTIWVWNPEGGLTEEEFNILNRQRKILSNAIGIKTASGVRHDVNEV